MAGGIEIGVTGTFSLAVPDGVVERDEVLDQPLALRVVVPTMPILSRALWSDNVRISCLKGNLIEAY